LRKRKEASDWSRVGRENQLKKGKDYREKEGKATKCALGPTSVFWGFSTGLTEKKPKGVRKEEGKFFS